MTDTNFTNVMNIINFLLIFILTFTLPLTTFAASEGDLSINQDAIRFGSSSIVEGQSVRIYATISNLGEKDLLGTVRFYDAATNTQIESDQPVSVLAGKSDDVYVDWIPAYGSYTIKVTVEPWNAASENIANNSAETHASVDKDTDRDGIGNSQDPDDDNDGASDANDAFPENSSETTDTDKDGTGNNKDRDNDNDEIEDTADAFPFDSSESLDTDSDKTGNNTDLDDDNDTLLDTDEILAGTDPLKADTDDDKVPDNEDAFPLDPSETEDFDKDGIGNNKDADDDNDGLADPDDRNDENKGPIITTNEIPENITVGEEIVLEAGKSSDPDGKIVMYEWKVDGKKAGNKSKLTLSFAEEKTHEVSLTVTDNRAEQRTKTFKIRAVNHGKYAWGAGFLILLAIFGAFYYSKRRHARSEAKCVSKKHLRSKYR